MRQDDLLALWRARDTCYGLRETLTVNEVAAIVAYRRSELDDLDPADRGRAWARLAAFYADPPRGRYA